MSALSVKPETHAADTGGVGLSANAFAEIYREHMPELTRYCRSIVRDGFDAEDAAQAAMERAFKALADGGPRPERMRPWLFTIAQREAINVLRKRRGGDVELDKATLIARESPEDVSAVRERLAQLLADLRELAPRQRELLVARELAGRSYKELARQYGTTEAAAQQAVLEARQSLVQFERGRSMECDSVQRVLSARDHARVRTRHVRAHLRACDGCRGFQSAIRTRRRDFSLLLPGLGSGAAWWSALAGLLGQGSAKAVTAGAVVATGVALVGAVPLLDRGDVPPLRQDFGFAATATPTATPVALTQRFAGAAAASDRTGATTAQERPSRTARREGSPRTQRVPTGAAPAATAPAHAAATPEADRDRDRKPAARPAPSATTAPAGPPPASSPSGTGPVDLREVTEPVRDVVQGTAQTVDETLGTVQGTVDDVTDAVTPLLKPKLP